MIRFSKLWLAGVGATILMLSSLCAGCGLAPAIPPTRVARIRSQVIDEPLHVAGHDITLVRLYRMASDGTSYEYCFGVNLEGGFSTLPMALCD